MTSLILFLFLFVIIETLFLGFYYHKNKNAKINSDLKDQEKDLYQIQKEINNLNVEKNFLLKEISKNKQEIELGYEQEKEKINEQIKILKANVSYASDQYIRTLEKKYTDAENKYLNKIQEHKEQEQEYLELISQYEDQIQDLKATLNAGARAQLQEREKKEQLNYYKLNVSQTDLEDILKLNNLKLSLNQPIILSKLIWTTYFQKQTNELCARVLKTNDIICGIYKITNIETQQCYIGQSRNIAKRFKDHIRSGLGIDASKTNKLYNAMNEQGVWNFTFELLEECEKEQLNEKEAFWIEIYDAVNLGYNTVRGTGINKEG